MRHFIIVVCLVGAGVGCGANKGAQKGTDETLKSISTVVSPEVSNRPAKSTEAGNTGTTEKNPSKTPGKNGTLPPR
jgi:hypothetical protein